MSMPSQPSDPPVPDQAPDEPRSAGALGAAKAPESLPANDPQRWRRVKRCTKTARRVVWYILNPGGLGPITDPLLLWIIEQLLNNPHAFPWA